MSCREARSPLMNELRVPTHATPAEIRSRDGRIFLGRVFIPESSSHHSGPMRVDEWMNESSRLNPGGGWFFPFLPDDSESIVLLNREQIAMIVVAPGDDVPLPEEEVEATLPHRRVAIEVGDRRLEGTVLIDMPDNQRRVLDYLNRPGPFLLIRNPDRWYLVQKELIDRVIELQEG
jgi:hypothetical protein